MITINDLEKIHYLAKEHIIQFTDHANKRASERAINIFNDILPTLQNCEIIEEYPDDYPYKSFLILGYTNSLKPLHIVCSVVNNVLWIITEYFPDNTKWENDFKTRKE